MNLTDLVTVTLTQAGADIINSAHQCFNKQFSYANLKDDYKVNDEWCTQLWCVCEMFGPTIDITADLLFSSLEPRCNTTTH